jgi:hypothetical protein
MGQRRGRSYDGIGQSIVDQRGSKTDKERTERRRIKMSLLMHKEGGRYVAKEELDLIPMPEATESYVPVSHYHLADKFLTISQDILRDYTLIGENYGIARQGNQLFAVLKFKNDNSEMGLSIAFRNSYDRSMAIGMAVGSQVFCCDNLSLSGEIVVMKKHTKNVWAELEETAIATIYKSQKNYEQIVCDACTSSPKSRKNALASERSFTFILT